MSYVVLARKHRPHVFADMVGQEHVGRTLGNAIRQDRVHHAYLFAGARGLGKTTTARIFAKGLVCEQGPTPDPCNACEQCVSVNEGRSVDVVEIDGASNNSVENIRNLREQVHYLPQSARRKVYIIDEVHMLTTSAFNALLKTLEEPPPHVNFIFATTEPQKVIPTILSRVSRLDFRRVSPEEAIGHLRTILEKEERMVDDGGLRLIARACGGSVRDSLTLLDQVIAFADDPKAISEEETRRVLGQADRMRVSELVDALLEHDSDAVMSRFDELVTAGHDLTVLSVQLLEHMRDLTLAKVCRSNDVFKGATESEIKALREQSAKAEAIELSQMFDRFSRVVDRLHHSRVQRMLLEMGLLELANAEPLVPLGDIIDRLDALGNGGGGGGGAPSGGGGSFRAPSGGGTPRGGRGGGARASAPQGPTAPVSAAPTTPEHSAPATPEHTATATAAPAIAPAVSPPPIAATPPTPSPAPIAATPPTPSPVPTEAPAFIPKSIPQFGTNTPRAEDPPPAAAPDPAPAQTAAATPPQASEAPSFTPSVPTQFGATDSPAPVQAAPVPDVAPVLTSPAAPVAPAAPTSAPGLGQPKAEHGFGESELMKGLWDLAKVAVQDEPAPAARPPHEPPAPAAPTGASPRPAAQSGAPSQTPSAAQPGPELDRCGPCSEPPLNPNAINLELTESFTAWEAFVGRIREREEFVSAVLAQVGLISLEGGTLRVCASKGSFPHIELTSSANIRSSLEQAARDHLGGTFTLELIDAEPGLDGYPSLVLVNAHRKEQRQIRVESEAAGHGTIQNVLETFNATLLATKPLDAS